MSLFQIDKISVCSSDRSNRSLVFSAGLFIDCPITLADQVIFLSYSLPLPECGVEVCGAAAM